MQRREFLKYLSIAPPLINIKDIINIMWPITPLDNIYNDSFLVLDTKYKILINNYPILLEPSGYNDYLVLSYGEKTKLCLIFDETKESFKDYKQKFFNKFRSLKIDKSFKKFPVLFCIDNTTYASVVIFGEDIYFERSC